MTNATLSPRNRSRKPACGRALADHQFVGCLERSAATETWESRTTDGRRWLVKVLFNVAGPDPKRAEAVQRLQALNHPNLVPTRILPGGPGCLVVASEFPGETLFDFLKQHQLDGAPGIPRQALIRWLCQAAIALDEIEREFGVSHLGLTPKNLQTSGNTLLIADHGLLQLMWLPTGQFQGQVQPRYAAPELPNRQKSGPACDQFSLAAIYQELLTGTPPFRTRPAGRPELASLAEKDRAVIARALDFDPKKRFPSCLDLIDELQSAGVANVSARQTERIEEPTQEAGTSLVPAVEPSEVPTPDAAAPLVPAVDLPEELTPAVVSVPEVSPPSGFELEEVSEDEIKTIALALQRPPTWDDVDLDAPAPAAATTPAVPKAEVPTPEPIAESAPSDVEQPQLEWADLPAIENETVEPTPEVAADPAPPVEPTRLWNEEHSSAHDMADLDQLHSQPANTIPFDEIIPVLNLSTESETDFSFLDGVSAAAAQAELPLSPFEEEGQLPAESTVEETVPPDVSPFDQEYVPRENELDSPSDEWPLPAPSNSGSKRTVSVSTSDTPGIAVAERQTAALPEFSVEAVEEPAPTPAPTAPEPAYEPFSVTLSTAKLMPKPGGEAPELVAPKAEAPKPIFRTLRSLRRENDSQKSKSVSPVSKSSGQTARRRAAELKALLEAATKAVPPNEPERWITTAEEGDVLECRFPASLPPTGPPINFERFREKWNGKVLATDDDSALFEVGTAQKFWKRLLGRPTPVYVEVRWSRPRPPAVGIPGVMMRIRLAQKGDKRGEATLHQLAPLLVESLRTQLQGGSERRREQRVLWVQPVAATFLLSNGDASGTVDGQSRDLTAAGMGLYLPRILPGTQVSLRLTDPGAAEPVTVVGKFVRVQRCGDGWYEVGVRFEM